MQRYRQLDMHATLRKLLVGALLLGGFAYFALVRDEASPDGLVLWDPSEASVEDESAPTDPTPAAPGQELPLADNTPDQPRVVRGRVVRADGEPIANAEVRRSHPYLVGLSAHTNAMGNFELSLEAARGELELVDRNWIVLGGLRHIDSEQQDEHLLVAAPRGRVVGRVVAADGVGVADVLVRLSPPSDALVPFGVATPPVELESWRVWSSTEGGFRFDEAPLMGGVTVEVEHAGSKPVRAQVVFENDRAELLIQLVPSEG